MKDIKIKSVKLIKGGEKMEVVYKETGENKSTVDKTCEDPVHPDLKRTISAFDVHLAVLTDYITEKQITEKEVLEKFVITGYSIGGKEDQEGITITGYRKTKRGGTFALNSPFTRFDEDPQTRYLLMEDVMSKIDLAEKEVLAYLFEGKKGIDPQGSLFGYEDLEVEEAVTHMQVAGPKTIEEEDKEVLDRLKSKGKATHFNANPEAMERLKNWDHPEVSTSELIQNEKNKLRGKGGRKAGKK
jgi:hypothetical protein